MEMAYTKEQIEQLLAQFMDGATTLEEEQMLTDFFHKTDIVPDEWREYKRMFDWFGEGMPQDTARRTSSPLKLLALAAAFVGFVIIGITLWMHKEVAEGVQPVMVESGRSLVERGGRRVEGEYSQVRAMDGRKDSGTRANDTKIRAKDSGTSTKDTRTSANTEMYSPSTLLPPPSSRLPTPLPSPIPLPKISLRSVGQIALVDREYPLLPPVSEDEPSPLLLAEARMEQYYQEAIGQQLEILDIAMRSYGYELLLLEDGTLAYADTSEQEIVE